MILQAGGATYTVVAVETTSSVDTPEALGYCNVSTRQIELCVGQDVDCAMETLAHEYEHACEAAGIDVYRSDPEKRATAVASIACALMKQLMQQGGPNALRKLLGISSELEAIEREHPEIDWGGLDGSHLFSTVLRHVYCRSLSDIEFAVYRAELEATRLNPFLGECYALRVDDGSIKVGAKMPGLRRIAREEGAKVRDYEWCGVDGVWQDKWISPEWGDPRLCRCPIITREGELVHGQAAWNAYAPYIQIKEQRVLNPMWQRMGPHNLAICAERLAIARVCPPMSNVFIIEEFRYRRQVRSVVIPPKQIEYAQEAPEEIAPVESMDALHEALTNMGVTAKIAREAFVLKARKNAQIAPLESDDPAAFYGAVMKLASASFR